MPKFICEMCGKEIYRKNKKGAPPKYCSDCKKEVDRKKWRNRYRESRELSGISVRHNKKRENRHWVYTGIPRSSCPVSYCKFKSGDKPCLFYIERKNGEYSCPNIKELKREIIFGGKT